MWGWYGGPGGWWIFPLVMPLVMITVMLVMAFVFRGFFGSGPWSGGHRHDHANDDALDILRRRLANGEINDEEYQAKRKLLLG
jgi:putative membrane protein